MGQQRICISKERLSRWLFFKLFFFSLLLAGPSSFLKAANLPYTGFVIHFDHLSSSAEARGMIRKAEQAGATVINIVPPAHIWESSVDMQTLDGMVEDIGKRNLHFLFTRIDACYLPDVKGNRHSYLYTNITNKLGTMPSGKPTINYFWTTVNAKGYRTWMEEETRYYARRYGKNPRLLGIDLGPFSEPFVSQRSGLVQFDLEQDVYECTQYTPEMLSWWHHFLQEKWDNVDEINQTYQTHFKNISDVPMPLNEGDQRFGKSAWAYFDFLHSINNWYWQSYQTCRQIWHSESGRSDVPFILQMSGYDAEKFIMGRDQFWALEWMTWMRDADAIGVSLYTNNGYTDNGHKAILATVRVIQSFIHDKPCFVLESGTELPFPTFDKKELSFLAERAPELESKTFIYEFFKKSFEYNDVANDGRLIMNDGKFRMPVFEGLQDIFKKARQKIPKNQPELIVVMDATAVRQNNRIGQIYKALLSASAELFIQWDVAPVAEKMGTPVWFPRDLQKQQPSMLEKIISEAPSPTSDDYQSWFIQLREILHSHE